VKETRPVVKRLSFVRRAATVAPDEFARRWHDEARRTVASMPAAARPRRLAHCVVCHRRERLTHDGVAIAWHDDESVSAHDEWIAQHQAADSAVDVAATSVVRVRERTVFGDPWLEERWGHGGPQLLMIGLIEALPGMTREDFAEYWWSQHRPLANRLLPPSLQPLAYVHDYVLPGETTRWAGIGELYDGSVGVARQRGAWFDSPAAVALVADEDRFLVRSTRGLLVTNHEVIINEGVIA
jgi:hypothetical protein